MTNSEMIIYQSEDGQTRVDVRLFDDTVWLNRGQIAQLFGRDIKTIGKHINNALAEELSQTPVIANFATTAADGKTYQVDHYNLDMVLSVGYRVKSSQGIKFRIWANSVLKEYLVKGYAKHDKRLQELGVAIEIMKRSADQLESTQILGVIAHYSRALDLLDDYDHHSVTKPQGKHTTTVISYSECRAIIDEMKFTVASALFGNEKDESFKSSIATIYQTFGGNELYPSTQEKAANLLYLIIKNHSFSDGNKRIAAAIFVYYLNKTNILFDGSKNIIDNDTLVALTIMIACSKPQEKEMMVSLVMNFLDADRKRDEQHQ
ncbi:cytochrome c [Campylobacterota bacterium]|nr:cytochrome c [Campylobacterota bacterium]